MRAYVARHEGVASAVPRSPEHSKCLTQKRSPKDQNQEEYPPTSGNIPNSVRDDPTSITLSQTAQTRWMRTGPITSSTGTQRGHNRQGQSSNSTKKSNGSCQTKPVELPAMFDHMHDSLVCQTIKRKKGRHHDCNATFFHERRVTSGSMDWPNAVRYTRKVC